MITSFLDEVYKLDVYPAPKPVYSVHSPLIGRPLGTQAQAIAWFVRHSTQYEAPAIATIISAYARIGTEAGVDWFLALAQCAHETGNLSSWWSARPRRNPAGIGVTGDSRVGAQPGPAWAFDADRGVWLEGASFPRWDGDAVRAHLGRLLAYALPPGAGTPTQRALLDAALRVRPLPATVRGYHWTIGSLSGAWAVDRDYGGRVVARANAMREGR